MRTNTHTATAHFNFWEGNETSKHFKLSPAEIKKRYEDWKDFNINKNPVRGQAWFDYYNTGIFIRSFITDDTELKGLNSTFEEIQFLAIYKTIKHINK